MMKRNVPLFFTLLVALGAAALGGFPAFASDEKPAPPDGKVELELELPEPYYGGEERSFKKRPPFYVPQGAANLAKGKAVTSSATKPLAGKLELITDGDKRYFEKGVVELPEGVQYVQIDLGVPSEIYAVLLWHYHAAERVYFDTIAKVAEDKDFTQGVKTVFNNDHDNSSGLGIGEDKEYIESYQGKLIDAGGVKGRYIRLYSNGNTTDEKNHYVEVEVYCKPVE